MSASYAGTQFLQPYVSLAQLTGVKAAQDAITISPVQTPTSLVFAGTATIMGGAATSGNVTISLVSSQAYTGYDYTTFRYSALNTQAAAGASGGATYLSPMKVVMYGFEQYNSGATAMPVVATFTIPAAAASSAGVFSPGYAVGTVNNWYLEDWNGQINITNASQCGTWPCQVDVMIRRF